jgi:hypothetical protein
MIVLVACLASMQVVGVQIRLQSAAADAARMLGRGDDGATEVVSRAVRGATITSGLSSDLVCVEARGPVSLSLLGTLTVVARSCALHDPSP